MSVADERMYAELRAMGAQLGEAEAVESLIEADKVLVARERMEAARARAAKKATAAARRAERARSEAMVASQPQCPRCFLMHAGEC